MSKKFKAAWLEKSGEPLIIDEVVAEPLDEGQVRVKLAYSGVCHSQLMEARGKRGVDKHVPHLLGHEATGTVDEIGQNVTKVKEGDRVILTWIKSEGSDVKGGKVMVRGRSINAGPVTTFSEYTTVSENRIVRLPSGLPMDVGVFFGCALPTGLGIVIKELNPEPNKSAMVIGLGGVGLCSLMGFLSVGCRPVIAVDTSEKKLELAKKLGADFIFNAAKDDIVNCVREVSAGGVEYSVDAAGKSKTIETAFECTRQVSGRCIFASHPPNDSKIQIDPYELITGKTIRGSWGGACKPDSDLPVYAELFQKGKLPLHTLIDGKYGLDDINDVLNRMEAGLTMRPIIQFG